jgi:hypothetical protein
MSLVLFPCQVVSNLALDLFPVRFFKIKHWSFFLSGCFKSSTGPFPCQVGSNQALFLFPVRLFQIKHWFLFLSGCFKSNTAPFYRRLIQITHWSFFMSIGPKTSIDFFSQDGKAFAIDPFPGKNVSGHDISSFFSQDACHKVFSLIGCLRTVLFSSQWIQIIRHWFLSWQRCLKASTHGP